MAGEKFSSLAVGRHFTLGGIAYVKVSPLLARSEADGAARMIPRSALVEAADAATAATTPPSDDPARAALDDYHHAVLACLDSLAQSPSANAIAAARTTLSVAHARALKRLDARK